MRIYPVSNSFCNQNLIRTQNENKKPLDGKIVNLNNNIRFGSKEGWLAALGVAAVSVLAPVAGLVVGAAALAGIAASELADNASEDKKKQISDSAKDMLDDSINDSFPY